MSEPPSARTYEELQQEIIRLKEADGVRDREIKNLISRIEQLERSSAPTGADDEQPTTRVDEGEQKEITPEVQERMRKESAENYQLIQKAFEQRLEREGGMLLAPFRLTYEPGISYSHASYDSVVVDGFTIFPVLVVGDIVSEKIRRDIVTNIHSFRLGLPRNTQFDLVVPLGYERNRIFRDDGTHVANETKGLGDISLALSYQLVKRSGLWPDTVVGVSWKSKSGDDPYKRASGDVPSLGTGFNTWGVSMTSITTADPMVLFGGASATFTSGSDKKIGHVSPGESFGLNLGMALSLNLDTSLSFNYSYNYTLETEIDRQAINGSD
ncbi:MAG: coiled-coil domain-containing protein 22, partial [Deltaproteobacteria bacterium]|nr:coiled-coil domain-containing protein 22 [Deltaproteobacteria bacterium]